ncbi:MAG: HAMP domain-containing histidine kinase [Gemmatimonadetes bacterium]|nr:HAMP domain-containing histidine kinase [Gemmatimonadota bacterium]
MTTKPATGLRRALAYPGMVLTAMLALSLAFAVGAPLVLASRNLSRLSLVDDELVATAKLQGLTLQLQGSMVSDFGGDITANFLMVDALRQALDQLDSMELPMDPQTRDQLQQLRLILSRSGTVPSQLLGSGLQLIQNVAAARYGAQEALLRGIRADAANERRLALWSVAVLALLLAFGAFWVRRRLVRPLGEMTELLGRVATGNREPVAEAERHPLMAPVFDSYNGLVERLRELEREHQDREASLESEVDRASRALLEQHRTLADAERLAVVGATAAGLAHDLRNPLAGVLVGLGNLKAETEDEDTGGRLDLLSSEVRRVVDLLNSYLASARHTPEPSRPTDVGRLVNELVALLGRRTLEGVKLGAQAEEGLVCELPRDRVRQTLLNLILNGVEAVQGVGTSVVVRAAHEDDWLTLTVSDDGPGFPPGFTADTIRPFASARSGGTGLGLATVRRTVQDLGGTLELSNQESGGARVVIRIPWRAA